MAIRVPERHPYRYHTCTRPVSEVNVRDCSIALQHAEVAVRAQNQWAMRRGLRMIVLDDGIFRCGFSVELIACRGCRDFGRALVVQQQAEQIGEA